MKPSSGDLNPVLFSLKSVTLHFELPRWTLKSHSINEALSDVNTMLDGSTYPGWKLFCFSSPDFFLANENRAGYIWDQCCHLQGDGASLLLGLYYRLGSAFCKGSSRNRIWRRNILMRHIEPFLIWDTCRHFTIDFILFEPALICYFTRNCCDGENATCAFKKLSPNLGFNQVKILRRNQIWSRYVFLF